MHADIIQVSCMLVHEP